MEALNYYRCQGDCLEVIALNGKIEPGDTCAVCGSTKWLYMGHVRQDHLIKEEERVPCNTLCTHASGPICNCRCGGHNHGTGRVVVRVIEKNIPTIPAHDFDKACVRRDEYRPLRKEIESYLDEVRRVSRSYQQSYEARRAAWRVLDRYKKLIKLQSHFHRVKHAKALIDLVKIDFKKEGLND